MPQKLRTGGLSERQSFSFGKNRMASGFESIYRPDRATIRSQHAWNEVFLPAALELTDSKNHCYARAGPDRETSNEAAGSGALQSWSSHLLE